MKKIIIASMLAIFLMGCGGGSDDPETGIIDVSGDGSGTGSIETLTFGQSNWGESSWDQ